MTEFLTHNWPLALGAVLLLAGGIFWMVYHKDALKAPPVPGIVETPPGLPEGETTKEDY